MTGNALGTFSERTRSGWGPLTSELIAKCSQHLEALLRTSPSEAWLASLHREAPANAELYRDPALGFVLLAHTEPAGLYRPPHDHGRSWVIYGIQQGEIEMGTYARVEDSGGRVRLVKRSSTRVLAGQVQVYLPGDIHDTRCVEGPALLFRFSERDLKKEDREEHQVVRYEERDGVWTTGPGR